MKRFKLLGQYLIYLVILAAPFYIFRYHLGSTPTTLLEVIIYLSFAVNLISGNLKIKNKKVIIAVGVFLIFALIGALIDPSISRGLGLWKAYFFDGVLVYLMVSSFAEDEKMPLFLSISGALAAIATLVAAHFTADGRLLDLDRLSPNYLALFLSPIFIIALYQAVKNRFRVINIAGGILMLIAIVLSDSRGGYVAVIGGLIVIGLTYSLRKYSAKKVWLVGAILLLVLLGGTYAVFRPQNNDTGRIGSSSNIRYYIWQTSIEMIGRNPIWGVGLGAYQDSFKQLTDGRVNYNEYISPEALTAHDLYLELYLTSGLFGLISFLLMLYFALKKSKNYVIISALAVILIYGLIDTPIFRNDLAVIFWTILALL